jgi:nucleoid-associated protein Lsr2
MAQKVTVRAGRRFGWRSADETVRFGFGGAEYEIDLRSENASAFRKQLTPFIEHARRGGRRLVRPDGPDGTRTGTAITERDSKLAVVAPTAE